MPRQGPIVYKANFDWYEANEKLRASEEVEWIYVTQKGLIHVGFKEFSKKSSVLLTPHGYVTIYLNSFKEKAKIFTLLERLLGPLELEKGTISFGKPIPKFIEIGACPIRRRYRLEYLGPKRTFNPLLLKLLLFLMFASPLLFQFLKTLSQM